MAKETLIETPPLSADELYARLDGALNQVRAVFGLEPSSWGAPTRSARNIEKPAGTIAVVTETRSCSPFSLERVTARHPDGVLYSTEVTLSMMEAPFIRFYLYGNETAARPIASATYHEGYLREEQSAALLSLFRKLFQTGAS